MRSNEQVPGQPGPGPGPAPRRPPNRLVTDYDADISRRVAALARRRAQSRDPELISLARDVIDPPPINNAGYKMFKVTETPQSTEVDRILEGMVSAQYTRLPSLGFLVLLVRLLIFRGHRGICKIHESKLPSRISMFSGDRREYDNFVLTFIINHQSLCSSSMPSTTYW